MEFLEAIRFAHGRGARAGAGEGFEVRLPDLPSLYGVSTLTVAIWSRTGRCRDSSRVWSWDDASSGSNHGVSWPSGEDWPRFTRGVVLLANGVLSKSLQAIGSFATKAFSLRNCLPSSWRMLGMPISSVPEAAEPTTSAGNLSRRVYEIHAGADDQNAAD